MAEEIICPNCKRPSYTTAPYEPSPCPYCGYIFCETGKEANKMRRQILVIDDLPTIRDLLVDILTQQGYEVHTAGNGTEGLRMAYDRRYDMIISDIDMPVMNGIEFYKNLIEKMPFMRQRVLFITANTNRGTDMFIREMGIRYLLKPFKTADLFKAIDEIGAFKPNG